MGGCCSSRITADAEGDRIYHYCPRTIETAPPSLSFTQAAQAAASPGLVHEMNNLSCSDAYPQPSMTMQYDVGMAPTNAPPDKNSSKKTFHIPKDSALAGETNDGNVSESSKASECQNGLVGEQHSESMKASECQNGLAGEKDPGSMKASECQNGLVGEQDSESMKASECQNGLVGEQDSLELVEEELSKVSLHYPLNIEEGEEDVCPTCLEEYDFENPKINTKCGHHYHLSCIFEWMERSDICPVCNKIMEFDM